MARKIDQIPADGEYRVRYPWGDWLDGSLWELQQGVDFSCKVHSFCVNACSLGSRWGLNVKTLKSRKRPGVVLIQARPRG